ncbi:hypothetical protein [Longimicrobium sp.]|uniref:hypothetical protein n=1 Tax=Longimicrobium sp. TaxID=2029185 RepID=UPI002E311E57|nr:hypothetical protein [Longimicrobium sp.]HEX6039108.1 hypothetical protein [Longimicrobium sp.]
MYANCIFCSAALGGNESLSHFPVGSTLAFDGEKGRLWAVCPRCARWNLAPLEERWEAIEDAERRFRDCRLRAQRENIGLARLADGTRLVRVGRAGQGELAAWRYGRHLLRRRKSYLVAAGAVAATGGVAAVAAAAALVAATLTLPFVFVAGQGVIAIAEGTYNAINRGANRLWHAGTDGRVLLRLSSAETGGAERWLRKADFRGAFMDWDDEAGTPFVQVPTISGGFVALHGARARTALGRSLALMNIRGATPLQVQGAVRSISGAGSAQAWLERAARGGLTLELPEDPAAYWYRRAARESRGPMDRLTRERQEMAVLGDRSPLGGDHAYLQMRAAALEMALHEETERRALEGELAALEEMWRQAEEIASIADRLPDDVPAAVPPRLA